MIQDGIAKTWSDLVSAILQIDQCAMGARQSDRCRGADWLLPLARRRPSLRFRSRIRPWKPTSRRPHARPATSMRRWPIGPLIQPISASCFKLPATDLKRWEHEAVLDRMQARLDRMPEAMIIRRKTVEHCFGTLTWGASGQGEIYLRMGQTPEAVSVSEVRAHCMTRPVSEHDQPYIRSPLKAAAPTSRLRRAGAQAGETILKIGVSGHGFRRFVHPDPPETDQVLEDLRIRSSVCHQAAFITAPSMTTPAVTYFQSATSTCAPARRWSSSSDGRHCG